jgi:hypothetical protein
MVWLDPMQLRAGCILQTQSVAKRPRRVAGDFSPRIVCAPMHPSRAAATAQTRQYFYVAAARLLIGATLAFRGLKSPATFPRPFGAIVLPMLCAGLPTPHQHRPKASVGNGRSKRLTNVHSNPLKHRAAMHTIFVAWYNLARKHESLKNQTPAMASGLTNHVWTIKELIERAAA